MKILLVEDNRADARLFAELLSEVPGRPFQLTTVDTLAAARAQATTHDVLFLDLSLPDAHGLDTVTAMLAAARDMPIIVLTGTDDERVAIEAVKAGAQDYLTKSEITPSLIARTARYAVERKHAEENARKLVQSELAAARARFKASVTSAVTASFELGQTLPEVARLLVPTLGDYCVIDLVDRDDKLERIACASADAAHEEDMLALGRFVPGRGNPRSLALQAITSRKTVLVSTPSVADLVTDPDHLAIVRRLAPSAMLSVPMIARDRVVGSLSFAMGPRRSFSHELVMLAEEVAGRLALGIDNAHLYHAAQRAIAARDELLAVVSHDLRNPLGVVALALQMMQADPSEAPSALPRAVRAVDRMQRLIEDLLELARIDAGTLHVELAHIDLTSVVDESFELHRTLAVDKQITLERAWQSSDGAAVRVMADRHRIVQVLSNLLSNAIKFTPPRGTVRLGLSVAGDHVEIMVSDTGPGISREHLPHIFDRFYQTERDRKGIGLGLAIARGIVDAHGGTLVVESEQGRGATFTVRLRRDAASDTYLIPVREHGELAAAGS
jgi:signal transduction histidine kinase/DNA-binding response OmpR family regulator